MHHSFFRRGPFLNYKHIKNIIETESKRLIFNKLFDSVITVRNLSIDQEQKELS